MKKQFKLIGLALALTVAFSQSASAIDKVNKDSIGDVIKYVRDEYNKDDSPENRRHIAEWLTKVVDDRLINSNSSEWFSRPIYAWLAVYWVRNDPSYGDDYYNQANVSWSKGYGNCGENSIVVYYILKKAGVKEHVRYIQAGENRSHSFTVWGLPPDAITQNPDTWGDALVVDPWVGEVLDGPKVKDHIWFQNGNPDTPLRDSTTTVDEKGEDWNTIWREEMRRTGRTGANAPEQSNSTDIDSLLEDCFIATAVYGTPQNEEIDTLRTFRDQTLRKFALGRAFIKSYETFGPIAANLIRNDEGRKAWARNFLVEPALKLAKYYQ